jgi:hypothetical protein
VGDQREGQAAHGQGEGDAGADQRSAHDRPARRPVEGPPQRRRAPEGEPGEDPGLDRERADPDQALGVAEVARALQLGMVEVGAGGDRCRVDDLAARPHQPDRPLGGDHGGDGDSPDPERSRAPGHAEVLAHSSLR